jgi:hypothetical protein
MKLKDVTTLITRAKYTNRNCLSTLYGALFAWRNDITAQIADGLQSRSPRGFAGDELCCRNSAYSGQVLRLRQSCDVALQYPYREIVTASADDAGRKPTGAF